jgi:urea transport system permease protein
VYGKVFILVMVILFLQWRPSGLFAMKGRDAD